MYTTKAQIVGDTRQNGGELREAHLLYSDIILLALLRKVRFKLSRPNGMVVLGTVSVCVCVCVRVNRMHFSARGAWYECNLECAAGRLS